jgi:hypothetical protein
MTMPNLKKLEAEWDKRGYYLVGGKKYYSKLQAIAAVKNNDFPTFIFNDTEYSSANWAVEPEESLQEIYRQRALQLRQKYDHLVLCFSAGADSTNILHSFLYNNIPIDEILVYGPFDTTQGRDGKFGSRGGEFGYREIDLLALPYLREISKKYKFKVTEYSWSKDVLNGFKNSDWVWSQVNARMSPSIIGRNNLHKQANFLKLADRGIKTGFIFGIDKPRVLLKDNEYYCSFLDLSLQNSIGLSGIASGSEWEFDEYFYWTPDMTKIVVKQTHLIKNYIQQRPECTPLVENSDKAVWGAHRDNYHDLINRIIYPTWDPNTWQPGKSKLGFTYSENDSWFWESGNTQAIETWKAGINEVRKNIDSKWFNKGDPDHGFVGGWSKWYKIG